MAYTELTNLINTPQFTAGVEQAALYNNALIKSGVIRVDDRLSIIGKGGTTVQLQGYEPMTDDEDNINGVLAANVKNVVQLSQVAIVANRRLSYGASFIAGFKAYGKEPMQAISDGYGALIAQNTEKDAYAVIEGVFGPYSDQTGALGALSFNKSATAAAVPVAANVIDPTMVVAAKAARGSTGQKAECIIVHSSVAADMEAQKVLSFSAAGLPARFGGPTEAVVPTYAGLEVIVSDQVPQYLVSGQYSRYACYIATRGAILTAEQSGLSIEYFRNPETSSESYTSLRASLLHVLGTSWIGSTSTSPDRVAMALKTNYQLKWAKQNMGLTRLVVNSNYGYLVP